MSTNTTQLVKVTILVSDDSNVGNTKIKNARVALRSIDSARLARPKLKAKQSVEEFSDECLDSQASGSGSCKDKVYWAETDENAIANFSVPFGTYEASAEAFGVVSTLKDHIQVTEDFCSPMKIAIPVMFDIEWGTLTEDCQATEFNRCIQADSGTTMVFRVNHDAKIKKESRTIKWIANGGRFYGSDATGDKVHLNTSGHVGEASVIATMSEKGSASLTKEISFLLKQPRTTNVNGGLNVSLTRTETSFTEDTAFWTGIRNSAEALSFNNYLSFMDYIFCDGEIDSSSPQFEQDRFRAKGKRYYQMRKRRFLDFTNSDAYRVIKAATEAFVMVNCGHLLPEDNGNKTVLQPFNLSLGPKGDIAYLDRRDLPGPPNGDLQGNFNGSYLESAAGNGKILPYLAVIRQKLPDIPIKKTSFENSFPNDDIVDNCIGLLQEKLANPCLLELIWSYWHEEGMLVQSMNAISRRFQNIRSSNQDPLSNLEMDPLRPLNNLFWGYIQDEQNRLNVSRRNYEYDHHYGLRLEGKAVQNFRPVDTRSKFLEAFHHLLRLCTVFYKQDDDTTVKADAFPVLNALKEVHLILSQGAHNQFGDLPSTARIEMLMQQWLLARPEFREFLPTRIMVAYPEPWMDRVDAMKKLQGWTDTSVLHFRNLGMFGEQLLLSIRWGHWSDEFEPVKALNWARFFRPQVQGYIHAYRAATGADLSADPTVNASVDFTLPSILLKKRLATQQRSV